MAEIDDLFADLARHKQNAAAAAATAAAADSKKKKKEQELQQKKAEKEAREGREGQRYDPKRDDPDVRPCKYRRREGGEEREGGERREKVKVEEKWDSTGLRCMNEDIGGWNGVRSKGVRKEAGKI